MQHIYITNRVENGIVFSHQREMPATLVDVSASNHAFLKQLFAKFIFPEFARLGDINPALLIVLLIDETVINCILKGRFTLRRIP